MLEELEELAALEELEELKELKELTLEELEGGTATSVLCVGGYLWVCVVCGRARVP